VSTNGAISLGVLSAVSQSTFTSITHAFQRGAENTKPETACGLVQS
jgi:hypothetical protein